MSEVGTACFACDVVLRVMQNEKRCLILKTLSLSLGIRKEYPALGQRCARSALPTSSVAIFRVMLLYELFCSVCALNSFYRSTP